jgi:PAS domain S-box-containing protein
MNCMTDVAAPKVTSGPYRAIVEASHDEIFIVGEDNILEYVNPSAVKALGLEDAAIGRRLGECFAGALGREVEEEIRLTREGQTPRYSERRIVFPRGARWMGVWLTPIADAGGACTSVMGIARDVTERHELAELLARQHQLVSAVIEASPIGIMLLKNADGWICELSNPVIERLSGHPNVDGLRLAEAWPSLAPTLEHMLAHTADAEAMEIELPCEECSSKAPRQLSVTLSRLQIPGHHKASVLVLVTDMTERKHLEQQILQADKIDAIGRLAGGIAHDFNNLLTPILGFTELVVSTLAENDKRRADLDEVCRAAKSASALTRQLLTFSRKQVTQPIALDLNDVVRGVDGILRRTIGEDVHVVLDCSPGLDRAVVDRNQMEQVIMNLGVNARDAMPQGGLLHVRTTNVTLEEPRRDGRDVIPEGQYVCLTVADTGTGMSPEVQAHLFEPFFTTKGVGKGTGLGLSIVYGIVKQSGGHLSVSSEPGEGTSFTIYLPKADAAVRREVKQPAATTRPAAKGGETVLIVEDHDGLRRLAERLLVKGGYRVLLAENASEALRTAKEFAGSIDLLLTDVVMPGIDGMTLARQLNGLRPSTQVLFMSGYTGDDMATHGALSADVPLLQKPFTRDALLQAVRSALD